MAVLVMIGIFLFIGALAMVMPCPSFGEMMLTRVGLGPGLAKIKILLKLAM